jgi:hypothetical protein
MDTGVAFAHRAARDPAIGRRLFSTAAKYAGEASDCLICEAAARSRAES